MKDLSHCVVCGLPLGEHHKCSKYAIRQWERKQRRKEKRLERESNRTYNDRLEEGFEMLNQSEN